MTSTKTILLASLAGSTMAFAPVITSNNIQITPLHMVSSLYPENPLFDPFNLYGKNSKERISGQLRSLEPTVKDIKPVVDPLNIYTNKAEVDENVDMSDALPWLSRPIILNRELAGDVGFDPFNFVDSEEKLLWQREAELKHARIAMLAAAGWPLSEVFDKPLAHILHLKPLLGFGDRVPSVLNGGLAKVNPLYWVGILAIASAIEIRALNKDERNSWDPLGLLPKSSGAKKRMELAEVQNGRLAMMAIVGFAVQEFVTKIGVVNQTPIFFHPIINYVEYFSHGLSR